MMCEVILVMLKVLKPFAHGTCFFHTKKHAAINAYCVYACTRLQLNN